MSASRINACVMNTGKIRAVLANATRPHVGGCRTRPSGHERKFNTEKEPQLGRRLLYPIAATQTHCGLFDVACSTIFIQYAVPLPVIRHLFPK